VSGGDPAHHPLPATASKHPIVYFDAVRALSAQMVLVGHAFNIFVPGIFMVAARGRFRPSTEFFYMQNLGVLLFFVLSGFLVSRSALTKMSTPGWGYNSYLLERVARIFVPFVPAVLLVSVLDRLVLGGQDTPFIRVDLDKWTLATNLTMLYNNPVMETLAARTGLPLDTRPIGTAAPFWSVVIEFWIYVAFGLILLRLLRDRRLGILGVLALGMSLAVVVDTVRHHEGLVLAWVMGMLYAIGASRPWFMTALPHRVLGVAGLVATPWLLWRGNWDAYEEQVAFFLALAVLSTYVGFVRRGGGPARSNPRPLGNLARRGVTYLSDSSYSLYLVHFSLLIYLQTVPWLADHPLVAVPGAIIFANVVALAYWYLIERHYPEVRRAVRRWGLWPTDDRAGRAAMPPQEVQPGGTAAPRLGTRRREDRTKD